jgi:hypothetical protein
MSPGEWANATSLPFAANLSPAQGGGTTPATFFVMNDQNSLYMAVRIERPALDMASVGVDFDNDHDGLREPGDEAILRNVNTNGSVAVFDNYRTPCQFGLCAPVDTTDGGTTDGAGAATNDGVYSIIEFSQPLNSGDDAHDFSLSPGDVVGFRLHIRFSGPTLEHFADTAFPPFLPDCTDCANHFGDIFITPNAATIDIKPGGYPNVINLNSKGKIPVAVLSTANFNAPATIDPTTMTFGRTGYEASPSHYSAEDVNLDGFIDLVAHFYTQKTGFIHGDTVGILKAQTTAGMTITGTDSVVIIP